MALAEIVKRGEKSTLAKNREPKSRLESAWEQIFDEDYAMGFCGWADVNERNKIYHDNERGSCRVNGDVSVWLTSRKGSAWRICTSPKVSIHLMIRWEW